MSGNGYYTYLTSPEWAARRKAEFTKARNKCAGCGRRAQNVHHRTYARLGHEAESDLVALCKRCHLLAHLRHEEQRRITLWEATNAVIRAQRELSGLPPIPLFREDGTVEPAGAMVVKAARRKPQTKPQSQRRSQRRQKRWDAFFATPPGRLSVAEVETARTPPAGWTRKQLAAWGVPWPPPKGWKTHLTGTGTREGESNAA